MPGVFAAGDVRHGSIKRAAEALGEGAMAALAQHRLEEIVASDCGPTAKKTAYTIGGMRIAVNHLTFAEPIPASVIESAQDAVRAVVEAGGLDARLVKVDETHAILVLTFPDVETEERIKSEVGGPWMREHVVPLLAGPTERASGEVVAGSN